jgi:hypothetical protein
MSSAIQTLREDILQLERNQDGKLPLENIKQLITIYCLDLDTYISNGNFTIDELLFAFHPMDEATSARVGTKSVANEIEICIRQQIMSSLAAALNSNPTSLHEEAWTAVSEMIFAMPPTLSAFRASRYFIRITGEVLKRNIDLDWLLRLTRAFLIHQQRANCKAGPWPIRMARFAQAIAHICPAQKKELWAALQDLSRLGGTKRHVDHALHILLLAAHDPLWSRKDFAEAARDYVARFGPFRERYVWMLTVARLLARDAISDQGHRTLIRASHESRTAVWVSISASVIERKPQNLHDMIDWLQDIDGLDSFVWDLARSYIYHGSHVPPLVLTTLIEYPNSNKEVVWSILDAMGTLERSRGDLSTKKTLQLIDAVALRVEQGSNFSDRQAVRQITRAVHMQRKVSGRATPSVLASLADVATRDLQKGGWGRTQRLDMLVQTIESEQGLETARKARQQLLGWRSMIHERNWAMRRSRQRNAGREGDSTTVETH